MLVVMHVNYRDIRISIDTYSGGGMPNFTKDCLVKLVLIPKGGGVIKIRYFEKFRLVLGGLVSLMCTPPPA